MKIKTLNIGLVIITFAVLAFAGVPPPFAQGTAFTYQGRLTLGGSPHTGARTGLGSPINCSGLR